MLSMRISGAVAAVMGTTVRPDQPLVEAGLDSLGMHLPQYSMHQRLLFCITIVIQLTKTAKLLMSQMLAF